MRSMAGLMRPTDGPSRRARLLGVAATTAAAFVVGILGLLAFATAAAPTALAQDEIVHFASSDPITVPIKDGTGTASVVLVNGGRANAVRWTIQLEGSDAGTAPSVGLDPTTTRLSARSTTTIDLTVTAPDGVGKLTGTLVATPQRDSPPITLPLTIATTSFSLPIDPTAVAGIALLFATFIVGIRYLTLPKRVFRRPLGNPSWSFSTSWATTFTGAGALLTTIVASGALPAEPYLVTKADVAGLAILFAGLGFLAPVVFLAFNLGPAPVFGFHVATWLTTAGVIGQLTTIVLLVLDAFGQGTSTWFVAGIMLIEVAGLLAIASYVYRGIPPALEAAEPAKDERDLAQGETVVRPSWSLF